jgi:hypothetical protein
MTPWGQRPIFPQARLDLVTPAHPLGCHGHAMTQPERKSFQEVLLDDATRRAAAAATADVAVQLDVTPRATHVFQASAPELDEGNAGEASAALARTGAFLQAHLQLAQ